MDVSRRRSRILRGVWYGGFSCLSRVRGVARKEEKESALRSFCPGGMGMWSSAISLLLMLSDCLHMKNKLLNVLWVKDGFLAVGKSIERVRDRRVFSFRSCVSVV